MNTVLSQKFPRDLGVLATKKEVILYSNIYGKYSLPFQAGVSTDGLNFKKSKLPPRIIGLDATHVNSLHLESFRVSPVHKKYILFYNSVSDTEKSFFLAESKDGYTFNQLNVKLPFSETAMAAPNLMHHDEYVVYHGDVAIRVSYSKDFTDWKPSEVVLEPRASHFDKYPLHLGSVIDTSKGLLVVYFVKNPARDGDTYQVGAALFDKTNPSSVIWRSDAPIWEQADSWSGKNVYPMGAVHFKEKFILYFGIDGEGVHAVYFSNLHDLLSGRGFNAIPKLEKSSNNPIIRPVLQHNWEASSVFNSAAVHEGGKVHFVYRAMGPNNTSVLGYAASSDGETIDERSDEPIYQPTEWFEVPGKDPVAHYMSGGGYGGCEDPRITKVDDTFYMTYVAYNGEDPPRVALTSIKVDDFLNKRWDKWAKPKLISKPGVVNKNCVIFPEKINGKFVVIHRVFPDILLDFVDDLDFDDKFLEGHYKIPPRYNSWDSRKLGAGAPPIKTKDGWLLIYQAVDDKDPGKYKIGAMLLDLHDPTKVLYRANYPILEPSEWYEYEGFKPGVTYPCGAVIKDNKLMVYYGGADSVICAASSPIDAFLHQLKVYHSEEKRHDYSTKQVSSHFLN